MAPDRGCNVESSRLRSWFLTIWSDETGGTKGQRVLQVVTLYHVVLADRAWLPAMTLTIMTPSPTLLSFQLQVTTQTRFTPVHTLTVTAAVIFISYL